MNIAVIGSNGQLGYELCKRIENSSHTYSPFDIPAFDITSKVTVYESLHNVPDLIINASAYTAVDRAEKDSETAYAVNKTGPKHLALFCAEKDVPLIHVSTDYVFDGAKSVPYTEQDPVNPVGVYGKSKHEGELVVQSLTDKYIIIRTSWLYGVHGNNFVKTILTLAGEREHLRVVNDQFGCPTFAGDLAAAIIRIADTIDAGAINDGLNNLWGVYHYSGSSVLSWYAFAEKAIKLCKTYKNLAIKKLEPVTTEEYGAPLKRPAYTAFNTQLIQKTFGVRVRDIDSCLQEFCEAVFG